jgi:diadenosine tetraphosphate (Ap4A) HIT family hydrolase
MKTCRFCNKANLKPGTFYESQNFWGVYNIRPLFPGHSLIIAKRHLSHLARMNEAEVEELPSVVKTLMVVLTKAYKADGFNIVLQEGKSGGASMVDHFHLHLIPRKTGDIRKGVEWMQLFKAKEVERKTLAPVQQQKEVAKIRKAMARM